MHSFSLSYRKRLVYQRKKKRGYQQHEEDLAGVERIYLMYVSMQIRTLLMYLQFCASVSRLSLEMLSQPEMLRP